MSILRIITGPADVGVGGFNWNTASTFAYDTTRVEGSFHFTDNNVLPIPHDAPAATEAWYHFRYSHVGLYSFSGGDVVIISDENSNEVARFGISAGKLRATAVGDTAAATGTQAIAQSTSYSIDLHVTVAATITVRYYINGALYGEATAQNTQNRGTPRNLTLTWPGSGNLNFYFAELIVADEDTRGMRVREMRPKSFGIFQEWDGSISSLRDTDLATGISTDTADRRVSFGITNIEHVQPGDIINRVVAQTYAQKGETGLSAFNHFFRHRNGNVTDGATQTLAVLGGFFAEEFLTNPDTLAAWQPEDFSSLQSGIRSLA